MTELDWAQELQRLRDSLQRMTTLRAWQQVQEAEATVGRPSMFQRHDPTEDDLRSEYCFFAGVLQSVRSVLHDHCQYLHQRWRLEM